MANKPTITHATRTSNLADVLERVLDKGVVIAGDIKIKLVDIELLTIQIRLVVCSVERAQEMGMNWWQSDPNLTHAASPKPLPAGASVLPGSRTATLPLPQPEALQPLVEPVVPHGGRADTRPMEPAADTRLMEPAAATRVMEPAAATRLVELEQMVRRLEQQLAAQRHAAGESQLGAG